ncbi:hypothetical protein JRQ81_015045 [Phrynocephalus forsythii]|uniref:Myb/SANT-like DNA-binding domain-containing protein n=1 Tax=Phrynocephalus forsythii TaxID=171643 RepID=A0A9Q1B433_9SAUR|nr:hypothetical protein JRQ81_015045 [Phrynocephalus forsythii]
MDNEDSLDESQGSTKSNYEIFETISTELGKIGFSRTAEECRTKTKSLRKLYKQAVLHNNTSGSGISKFIWFDEMAQIVRTDTSIRPLQTTESESAGDTGAEAMEGAGDVLVTLDLFESQKFLLSGGSDVSGADTQSTEVCEPSTSGCSTAMSSVVPNSDNSRRCDPSETTNYEATLDPARRFAMLRKRKQRATAAACLDSTLSGFVNWVQRNTESNEKKCKR